MHFCKVAKGKYSTCSAFNSADVIIHSSEKKSFSLLVFERFCLFHTSITNDLPLNVGTICIILNPEQSLFM